MRCPPSELLHLNQAGVQHLICDLTNSHASTLRHSHKGSFDVWAGLDKMVSLKGGLRKVVIQQLRLLGIVGFPIQKYDLQNSTLQMQKQTAKN